MGLDDEDIRCRAHVYIAEQYFHVKRVDFCGRFVLNDMFRPRHAVAFAHINDNNDVYRSERRREDDCVPVCRRRALRLIFPKHYTYVSIRTTTIAAAESSSRLDVVFGVFFKPHKLIGNVIWSPTTSISRARITFQMRVRRANAILKTRV